MALIRCSECGKEISDKAGTCPNCGAPVSISTRAQQSERVASEKAVSCTAANVFILILRINAILWAIIGALIMFASVPAGICFILIVALAYIVSDLNYKRTYVKIENGVITGHIGIIRTKNLVSPVSKVQGVSISNGLFGKIFGYHTIAITTAGTDKAEFVFNHMANAKEFQELFVELTK